MDIERAVNTGFWRFDLHIIISSWMGGFPPPFASGAAADMLEA